MKTGLQLMENVLKPSPKSVLITLGLTVVASAADVDVYKKNIRSGTITSVTSNEEMSGIMKVVISLSESIFFIFLFFLNFIKGVNKYIENEANDQEIY